MHCRTLIHMLTHSPHSLNVLNHTLSSLVTHSLSSHTIPNHCPHSLTVLIVLTHCPYSLSSCTVPTHCPHSLSLLIHCPQSHTVLTHSSLIVLTHCPQSLSSLTHCPHSLSLLTVPTHSLSSLTHCPHSLSSLTVLTHSLSSLTVFTVPSHTLSSLIVLTDLIHSLSPLTHLPKSKKRICYYIDYTTLPWHMKNYEHEESNHCISFWPSLLHKVGQVMNFENMSHINTSQVSTHTSIRNVVQQITYLANWWDDGFGKGKEAELVQMHTDI